MFNSGLRTSETVEWSTPTEIVSQLEREFGAFSLDPCATKQNAKAPKYFTIENNGLIQSWAGERVFMNPPYGKTIADWMAKAYEESKLGALVVCLIPARTDTGWWHRFAMKGEIRFIRGRIQFGGLGVNAPFPSALIIFHPGNELYVEGNRENSGSILRSRRCRNGFASCRIRGCRIRHQSPTSLSV